MEKTPEYALEAGIAVWVEDNQEIVKCAIRLGSITTSAGLCDTNINPFMQIVPTEVFGSNGNLIHECFLNINHQAWGYYKIIIEDLYKFKIIEPTLARTKPNDIVLLSEDEVEEYIINLSKTLDKHYGLSDKLEEDDLVSAENILNEMLDEYHKVIDPALAELKSSIDNFVGVIAIKATNSEDIENVRLLSTRYDLALLHPENWFVYKSDGMAGQEWLHETLKNFQILENRQASLLYFAQKIIVDFMNQRLIVHTDSQEPESDLTAEVLKDETLGLTLVRPVIHATKLEIIK
jgi:hypothetical protein